jgi:hypothetical protein
LISQNDSLPFGNETSASNRFVRNFRNRFSERLHGEDRSGRPGRSGRFPPDSVCKRGDDPTRLAVAGGLKGFLRGEEENPSSTRRQAVSFSLKPAPSAGSTLSDMFDFDRNSAAAHLSFVQAPVERWRPVLGDHARSRLVQTMI